MQLQWPTLQYEVEADVIVHHALSSLDLVFLKTANGALPLGEELIQCDTRLLPNVEFISFGYRKANLFEGLFSEREGFLRCSRQHWTPTNSTQVV